jgi:ABC-type multidrug transport system permease subunit
VEVRFLWSTALKDLRRHRRNPVEFLLWIGIPIVIGVVIIMAAGGRGGPEPQAHLLIADHDDSFLSHMLVGALSQEAAGGLIRAEAVTEEKGRQRLQAGKASALLIIPDLFSEQVLREEPTTLRLLTNPSQRILPGIVEESLSILVDGSFYLHRLLGDDLRSLADGPPAGLNTFADGFIAAFSVRVNHIIDRLSRYLDPLVIELDEAGPPEGEEDFGFSSFALYFMPGILLMGLLFMAQGMGDEFWHERNQRTLRRVAVSPQGIAAFLGGKLLAGAALVFLVCFVGLCIGYAYFGLSVWTFPLAVSWATCAGVMLMSLMLQVQLRVASQRAGNILTMVLIFPLMMVGGSFFPFEAMPDWMAAVGRWTPNGWALMRLREILESQVDIPSLLSGFGVMLAVIAVLFLLSARRLRSGFVQG